MKSGAGRRIVGAAVAGILLALPPASLWAGGNDRGGPGRPPPPGQPGGQPGEMRPPEFDPRDFEGRVRKALESHPKYRRVWEKLGPEQRERCIRRVCQRLCDRRREMHHQLMKEPPGRHKRMKDEMRQKLRERLDRRRVKEKDMDAWLEKRRRNARIHGEPRQEGHREEHQEP